MKVLAALSGGVDSAVAAARAVDAGHDVTAVHLALARDRRSHRAGARGCCTIEDANDASRAADVMGIPYYVWDLSAEFQEHVVDDFIAEYAAGRTPNPCVRCNESIKFAAVLERAVALGFDAVCTGHYARLVAGPYGAELHRAVDSTKDQSYVLGVLQADQVARSLFPLGDSVKSQVRAEARDRGLRVADKPDSHDICFIPDGDTAGWLAQRIETQPGEVIDAESGQAVGRHSGAQAFTVGQRRGLALGNPTGDGQRRYVVDVDVSANRVFIGPPTLLDVDVLEGVRPRWAGPTPTSGDAVAVQVRAHGEAVPATVRIDGDSAELQLVRPLRGVAAGQSAVMYDGSRVVGSVTVARARRS